MSLIVLLSVKSDWLVCPPRWTVNRIPKTKLHILPICPQFSTALPHVAECLSVIAHLFSEETGGWINKWWTSKVNGHLENVPVYPLTVPHPSPPPHHPSPSPRGWEDENVTSCQRAVVFIDFAEVFAVSGIKTSKNMYTRFQNYETVLCVVLLDP